MSFKIIGNNNYIDDVNIFLGPNFVSPDWRCPLNRGVLLYPSTYAWVACSRWPISVDMNSSCDVKEYN